MTWLDLERHYISMQAVRHLALIDNNLTRPATVHDQEKSGTEDPLIF